MIFEQELSDGSNCHPKLKNAVKLWKSGDPGAAWLEAKPLLRQTGEFADPFQPDDWLFLGDIAAVCGVYEFTHIITARGKVQYPEHAYLGMLHAWDLSAKGKFFECQKQLDFVRSLGTVEPALLSAIATYNFSIVGWRESATRTHNETMEIGFDDAMTWYVLSRAASQRSEWELSIEAGQNALTRCPVWSRVRAALTDSLLALGQTERAGQILMQAPASPHCGIDFSRALCAEANGDVAECQKQLRNILATWPTKSKIVRFAARHLALMLVKEEKFDEARSLIDQHRVRSLKKIELKSGSQTLIPVPLVSQAFNHCVPTVAAMVASAQGVDVTPIELAEKMMTRHGTPMFRMIDEMKSRGFTAECIKVEPSIIENLLDAGIPLIGSLTGLFSSHVDVICGYHAGMQLFHFRDPMHWFGYSHSYKHLKKHYQETGGLWALISADRVKGFEFKDEWRDVPSKAYVDLGRACAQGDLPTAEESYQAIPDDHELAPVRDSYSNAVVITPMQFLKAIEKNSIVVEGQTPTIANLRSMLYRISDETADEIMEMARAEEYKLGRHMIDYVEAQCAMAKNDWKAALEILKRLVKLAPGMEQTWDQLATVQIQLGMLDDSRESLTRAIDIAPENFRLQNRKIELEGNNLTFDLRLTQVRDLMEKDPDRPDIYYQLSQVLRDGADAKQWESSIKTCLKYYPRDPDLYAELIDWYLLQGRLDLSREVLVEARRYFTEEEFPLYEFEKKDSEASDVPDSELTKSSMSQSEGIKSDSLTEGNTRSNSQNKPEASTDTSAEPPKAESRFDKLMREIGDRMEESEKDTTWEDLCKWEQVIELKADFDSRKLSWSSSVRFLSSLISTLLSDTKISTQTRAEQLQQTLPVVSIPGIPERFATVLIDMLPHNVDTKSATILTKWIEETCPNRNQFANLQFHHAFLLETIGKNNESETELNEIVNKHPAYAPAFFRLGQISTTRRDYKTAIEFHQKCLAITPANMGALDELIGLSRHLQSDDLIEWLERQRDLMPYSRQSMFDLARAVADKSGVNAGIEKIGQNAENFKDEDINLLKGRMFVDFEDFAAARKITESIQPSKSNRMLKEWILIDCMVADRDFAKLRTRLESLLKEFPDDADLIDQYARILRELDPSLAIKYAKKRLTEGPSVPVLCHIALADDYSPVETSKKIILKAETANQELLVFDFEQVFVQPDYLEHYVPFLTWAAKKFPMYPKLQESLALRLNFLGNDRGSKAAAKELLDEDPDNPRYIRLYGICIQDSNPEKSISYLQREYEITGSADTLCRLGRGYQLMNNESKAKEYYGKALDANPNDTLAITNLVYRYDVCNATIFDSIESAIRLGYGAEDQYFHVVAVKAAIQQGKKLPPEWFFGAMDRFQSAIVDGGFNDEVPMLRKCLLAFAIKHQINDVVDQIGGFIQNLSVRFWWPKFKWIPDSLK